MRTLTNLELRKPVALQLSAAGYKPTALVGIVPTHIHWDISGVPVWLNAVEHAFAREGGRPSALYRSFGELPTHEWPRCSGVSRSSSSCPHTTTGLGRSCRCFRRA